MILHLLTFAHVSLAAMPSTATLNFLDAIGYVATGPLRSSCDHSTTCNAITANPTGMCCTTGGNVVDYDDADLDESSYVGTGSLPSRTTWASLTSLVELDLVKAPLTGTIPDYIFNTGPGPSLETFSIVNAASLSGTLPASLAMAPTSLSRVLLSNLPLLSGTIPASLMSASTLSEVRITGTAVSGTIPASTSGNSFLILQLSDNQLFGSIPTTISVDFMNACRLYDSGTATNCFTCSSVRAMLSSGAESQCVDSTANGGRYNLLDGCPSSAGCAYGCSAALDCGPTPVPTPVPPTPATPPPTPATPPPTLTTSSPPSTPVPGQAPTPIPAQPPTLTMSGSPVSSTTSAPFTDGPIPSQPPAGGNNQVGGQGGGSDPSLIVGVLVAAALLALCCCFIVAMRRRNANKGKAPLNARSRMSTNIEMDATTGRHVAAPRSRSTSRSRVRQQAESLSYGNVSMAQRDAEVATYAPVDTHYKALTVAPTSYSSVSTARGPHTYGQGPATNSGYSAPFAAPYQSASSYVAIGQSSDTNYVPIGTTRMSSP
mmetsp:Transcript_12447/g.39349  ORF Transcript_12447/g.39349 Transcript_12447/m.39349 type:complete len:544 (+) Transcript_12447:75-1706(+)